MSHLGLMVREGKKIATALKKDYSSKGDKLGDVVKNAKNVPVTIGKKLSDLATIIDNGQYSNKPEDEYLENPKQFIADCNEVLNVLKKKPPQKTETPGVFVFLLILLFILFLFRNL